MKKTKIAGLILSLFLLVLAVSLCACTSTEPPETPEVPGGGVEIPADLNLSGITLPSAEYDYDGEKHSLKINGTLPEDVTVKYEENGKTDAGEYTVTAKFYYKNKYVENKDLTSTLKINKAEYDMYGVFFDGMTVVHDGKNHSIEISSSLPRGVRVTYTGNDVSALGRHEVTATFSGNKNYKTPEPMTAYINIIDGPDGLRGVSISDMSAVYSGVNLITTIKGTPSEDVRLMGYENHMNSDAGTYTVTAKFSEGGVYKPEYDLTATQTIKQARLLCSAEDMTVTFDGSRHSLSLAWKQAVPSDITVNEIGNYTARPGANEVIFTFSEPDGKDNYENIEIRATLTILLPANYIPEGLVVEFGNTGWAVTGYTGTAKAVVIPEKYMGNRIVAVASDAFRGNTNIDFVYLSAAIKTVGNNAFRGCTALRDINLDGVSTIGANAFRDTALREAHLSSDLNAIGQGAFMGCEKLQSLTLPFIGGSKNSSNTYLGYIFGAAGAAGNGTYVPKSLKTLVLLDSCREIDAYALRDCTGLESITIGAGVTYIGNAAFWNCTSLKSVYIPASVSEIPADATYTASPFLGCSEDIVIVTESAKTSDFGSKWNLVAEGVAATVVKGVSYEEYLAEYVK